MKLKGGPAITAVWMGFLSLAHPEASAGSKSLGAAISQPALRSGSERCWAQFPLEGGRLCLSRMLWKKILKDPSLLNSDPAGKWKIRAFPLNERESALPGFQFHEEKRSERILHVDQVKFRPSPAGDGISGIWLGLIIKIEQARETVSEWLRPEDGLGILRRLVLDERMPGSSLGLLRLLGFVHLFTASGIHLYALAQTSLRCVSWVGRRMGLSADLAVRFSRGISFFLGLGAWILAGMRPGMLRPWLLVMARTLAKGIGFRWRGLSPLLLALTMDLGVGGVKALFTEQRVLDWAPGRVHYALAVGGGFLALEQLRKSTWRFRKSLLLEHSALSLGSWVFTALWDGWLQGYVALATPALSCLTLPIFSGLIYPGVLIALLLQSHLLLDWLGQMTTSMIGEFAFFSLKLANIWIISRPVWILAALLATGLLLLVKGSRNRPGARGRPVIFSGCFAGLILLAFVRGAVGKNHEVHGDRAASVEQLDVGQGDAALVRSSAWAGLIDVGSEKSLSTEAWLVLFSKRGVRRLSWIAISHLDEDHVGALLKLAPLIPIDCVATSSQELHSEKAQVYVSALVQAGVRVGSWESGCFPFSVLGPPSQKASRKLKDGNQNMSAFWIPLQNGEVYFGMGDADKKSELRFLKWAQRMRKPGQKVIFKISHHGSRHSTSGFLLEELRPTVAWISAGLGNHHGHPTYPVLQLLKKRRIPLRRTDEEGSLKAGLNSVFEFGLKQEPAAVDHEHIARDP